MSSYVAVGGIALSLLYFWCSLADSLHKTGGIFFQKGGIIFSLSMAGSSLAGYQGTAAARKPILILSASFIFRGSNFTGRV